MKVFGSLFGAFCLTKSALSQSSPAPLEIQDGKVLGCAWIDGTVDTTVGWNQKTKYNSASFQFAQQIPLDYRNNIFPAPAWRISETGTDAYLLLTVYNDKGIEAITDSDIDELAGQINELNKIGRKVFLRLMPEMNGNWFPYGQKPTAYVALFRKTITRIRQVSQYGIFASVWSPNNGQGYPFSSTMTSSNPDFALLDTNKDGILDINDDPYSPYYPGDSYVDWVGLSIYYKGQVYSSTTGWSDNSNAPADQFDKLMNGVAGSETGTKGIPFGKFKFYDVYAKEKNKPFMVSEAGAAFHENSPTGDGVGELAMKQSWWRLAQTNRTITEAYPKLKLYCQFEETKPEEFGIKNNYHITKNPEVLNAFIKDFQLASSMYVFANFTNCTSNQIGASLPGASCTDPNGNSGSANGVGFMFLTGVLLVISLIY